LKQPQYYCVNLQARLQNFLFLKFEWAESAEERPVGAVKGGEARRSKSFTVNPA
jgi:hypothetical protein